MVHIQFLYYSTYHKEMCTIVTYSTYTFCMLYNTHDTEHNTHTHTHTHSHTDICTHTHACTHARTHTRTHAHTEARTHTEYYRCCSVGQKAGLTCPIRSVLPNIVILTHSNINSSKQEATQFICHTYLVVVIFSVMQTD